MWGIEGEGGGGGGKEEEGCRGEERDREGGYMGGISISPFPSFAIDPEPLRLGRTC